MGLKMEVAEAAESEPDFENQTEQGEKCTEVNCKRVCLKAGIEETHDPEAQSESTVPHCQWASDSYFGRAKNCVPTLSERVHRQT